MTVNTTWVSPVSGTLDKTTGNTIDETMTDAWSSDLYHLGGTAGYIGARANHNTTQGVATSTSTTLVFNAERWDSDPGGAIHDTVTANDRLTCRTAGLYHIGCNIEWTAHATGERRVDLLLNGTTIIASANVPAVVGGAVTRQNLSTTYLLAATNFLQVMVYQTSGTTLSINGGANAYEAEFWMTKA